MSYDTTEPKELHQSTIEYNAVEGILQYNWPPEALRRYMAILDNY